MTNTISLFARYNAHVDKLMYQVLDAVDPGILISPVGAYFESINGILNHILTSHLGWLVRFRDGGIASEALTSSALKFEHPGFGKILHSDYGDLKAHQTEVDRVIVELVGELSGADRVLAYVDTRGDEHRFRVGDILFQILNHATHHRGQISQVLDAAGVEHDYSGVFALLEEPQST